MCGIASRQNCKKKRENKKSNTATSLAAAFYSKLVQLNTPVAFQPLTFSSRMSLFPVKGAHKSERRFNLRFRPAMRLIRA